MHHQAAKETHNSNYLHANPNAESEIHVMLVVTRSSLEVVPSESPESVHQMKDNDKLGVRRTYQDDIMLSIVGNALDFSIYNAQAGAIQAKALDQIVGFLSRTYAIW